MDTYHDHKIYSKQSFPTIWWLWKQRGKSMKNLYKWWYTYWIELKTLWQMEKLLAHYEQFLHLPQCFQKSSAADATKWERVKMVSAFGKRQVATQPKGGLHWVQLIPLPHADAFWGIMSKYLLLQQCWHLIFSIKNTFIYKDFPYFCLDVFQMSAARLLYVLR